MEEITPELRAYKAIGYIPYCLNLYRSNFYMSRKDNDIKPPIYYRLKELLTEQRNPNTNRIDLATPREIVEMIHREDLTVAEKVGTRLDQIALAVEWVSESLRSGGRLLYFGAGTSGRLGVLDAAECPPTFGTPPHLVQGFIAGGPEAMFKAREGVEDSADSGRDAVADVNAQSPDVVCGLAASGRTPWVAGALKEAAKRGCRTLAVITVPEKQARLSADLIIDIPVGPEPLTGSTRMKSATAQKMVLNMITT
ncbi:MAG: N-acetylmuramic acid 6-phosphate etherase, partial [Balneolaceae bacterium]